MVQRYKSLADIERGFRVLKSDIEMGPVYHRLPKRIMHAQHRHAATHLAQAANRSAPVHLLAH